MEKPLRVCPKTGIPLKRSAKRRTGAWYLAGVGTAVSGMVPDSCTSKAKPRILPLSKGGGPDCGGLRRLARRLVLPLILFRKTRALSKGVSPRTAGVLIVLEDALTLNPRARSADLLISWSQDKPSFEPRQDISPAQLSHLDTQKSRPLEPRWSSGRNGLTGDCRRGEADR
jgi:hypothetical protein